jgi:ribonucleoside-diphosphate reductase beta chain
MNQNVGCLKVKPLLSRKYFKPFDFPSCFEAYNLSESMHWKPQEVKMDEDKKDWAVNLSSEEKEFLTQIFRFFTQADVEVCGYYNQLAMILQVPEINMMVGSFQNREALHVEAYSLLINTLNLPESEFKAFLEYKAINEKFEQLNNFSLVRDYLTPFDLLESIAIFSGFVEGLQLFASFAMLLNFQRHGKMKGMCQIVAWSLLDETHHTNSMIALYNELKIKFHGQFDEKILNERIYNTLIKMISHEDVFIDSCFKNFKFADLDSNSVKMYIRFIGQKRLNELNIQKKIPVAPEKNPFDWVDTLMFSPTHANFFETKPIEYSINAMVGEWS